MSGWRDGEWRKKRAEGGGGEEGWRQNQVEKKEGDISPR